MKRILHVIDSLHLGGAQEVILNLTAGADRSAFHHEVATLHGHGIYWDRLAAAGVPLHSLSPHRFVPLYVPRLLALAGRFDILHCHLLASNILAKPIGALCNVPVIINHDHTNDPHRAEDRFCLAMDRASNRFATHILAVSTSCREFLIQHENIAPDRVQVVWNAIDLARFHPDAIPRSAARAKWNIPADAPLIAGVGRLNPQKNFSLFLEIAARLVETHPTARFLIAGTGPEDFLLKEQAARLKLTDRLTFAGYVADSREVYAACDVLLMPSRFEGLPMTLLEAMATRTPVVASRLDGIAEVITDGYDGFLCAPKDAEAFLHRIRRLLDQPELARTLATRAAETIAARFSSERMVAEIEAVYRRLLP